AVRALAGHVAVQLFVLLRLTHRIHADVVFERREIDQPSLVVEVGHPIAESLGGFRRHCLDQFAQLTKAWLRRFRRSRYVRVNRLHRAARGLGGHFPAFILSTHSARRACESLTPRSLQEASMTS